MFDIKEKHLAIFKKSTFKSANKVTRYLFDIKEEHVVIFKKSTFKFANKVTRYFYCVNVINTEFRETFQNFKKQWVTVAVFERKKKEKKDNYSFTKFKQSIKSDAFYQF